MPEADRLFSIKTQKRFDLGLLRLPKIHSGELRQDVVDHLATVNIQPLPARDLQPPVVQAHEV